MRRRRRRADQDVQVCGAFREAPVAEERRKRNTSGGAIARASACRVLFAPAHGPGLPLVLAALQGVCLFRAHTRALVRRAASLTGPRARAAGFPVSLPSTRPAAPLLCRCAPRPPDAALRSLKQGNRLVACLMRYLPGGTVLAPAGGKAPLGASGQFLGRLAVSLAPWSLTVRRTPLLLTRSRSPTWR